MNFRFTLLSSDGTTQVVAIVYSPFSGDSTISKFDETKISSNKNSNSNTASNGATNSKTPTIVPNSNKNVGSSVPTVQILNTKTPANSATSSTSSKSQNTLTGGYSQGADV
jgi:hypothetical protein